MTPLDRERLQDPAKEPDLPADADVLQPLVSALASPSPLERRLAVLSLAELGEHALPALPSLIAAFCDRDLQVRAEAVRSVARLKKAAVGPLLSALAENQPDLRKVVIVTLGEIGPDAAEAVPALEAARADPWLAGCAEAAMEKIGVHQPQEEGARMADYSDWLSRVVPGLLAIWLVMALAGLLMTLASWGERGLFGSDRGAATTCGSVFGGVGVVLGLILGWSRGSVTGLLVAPIVLGLGGLLGGLFVAGLIEGMLTPLLHALSGSRGIQ